MNRDRNGWKTARRNRVERTGGGSKRHESGWIPKQRHRRRRVTDTLNVRTLAYKGSRGKGRNLISLLEICFRVVVASSDCRKTQKRAECSVALEARLDAEWRPKGASDRQRVRGVGMAIKLDIWDGLEEGDRTECFSPSR